MKYSYWDRTLIEEPVDIIIIGAGITGLSAAAALRAMIVNARIRVVDSLQQTRLASTRNAGFSCFGSPTELLEDIESQGVDKTLSLVERRWKGMKLIQQRFQPKAIDYHHTGGFELIPETVYGVDELQSHLDALNKLLLPIVGCAPYALDTDASNWPFAMNQHVVSNHLEGQLHPGKYTRALLRVCEQADIEVWQGVTVSEMNRSNDNITLATSVGNMTARRVVLATNGHTDLLQGVQVGIKSARNVVMVSKPAPIRLEGVFHAERGYIYFRNIGQRLLIGGGRHWDSEAEYTAEFGRNEVIIDKLKEYVRTTVLPGYPDLEFETIWSGILGFSETKQPVVKKIGEGIFAAVGFGGMGVALGMQAGDEVARLLINE